MVIQNGEVAWYDLSWFVFVYMVQIPLWEDTTPLSIMNFKSR
jgi:hypothetical protein